MNIFSKWTVIRSINLILESKEKGPRKTGTVKPSKLTKLNDYLARKRFKFSQKKLRKQRNQ